MKTENIDELLSVDSVLEQTLQDVGIPPRPKIIDRIAAEMGKADPNFKQLGQLIAADVSLSAGLIKTANSSFFGFHGRVSSPNQALMMLGLDVASRAIAGISLRNAFLVDKRLESFLRTSAQIAALSGWLTRIVCNGRLRADEAYTFGLFRDCGIPVMLKRFPGYERILARANDEACRIFTEVEQHSLPEMPIDHALVGCLLAKSWWLPQDICLAIRHHHEILAIDSGLPANCRYLIAIGQMAEHVLQQLSDECPTQEWSKLGASCLRLLDFNEDELETHYDDAQEVLQSVE